MPTYEISVGGLNSEIQDLRRRVNFLELQLKELQTKSKRGTRLPENWTAPKEYLEFYLDNKNPRATLGELTDAWCEFRDYWTALSGAKGVKADWFATWRNWVRKSRANNATNRATDNSAVGKIERANEAARQRERNPHR